MVYKFSELKGKLRVGMKVIYKFCTSTLQNGEGIITGVGEKNFHINGCFHMYDLTEENKYLEIIDEPITWDNLKAGDVLVEDIVNERTVLAVVGDCVFYSFSPTQYQGGYFGTKSCLQKFGWTIKQPAPTIPSKVEITLKEVADKFGIKVEDVLIKE